YLASTSHLPPIHASSPGAPNSPATVPSDFPRLSAIVTSAPKHTFAGHKDFVLSVAFGNVLAGKGVVNATEKDKLESKAAEKDPDAMDTSTGVSVAMVAAEADECTEWVVSGSKDRTVTFWDARGAGKGREPAAVAQMVVQGHKNS
ncbi:hypothetical protein HDU93_002958, partial [Gonapodya sp. JEL0774]